MIGVADDDDRENEGDLTMAAERVTPEAINFVIGERLNQLRFPAMVAENTSAFTTAFTPLGSGLNVLTYNLLTALKRLTLGAVTK